MSASINFEGMLTIAAPEDVPTTVPSLTEQVASHRGWRAWWQQSVDDVPSWLISLIVHLVAFLIVTSVAVPWTASGRSGSGTISLTLGFADRTQTAQGPEVTIEPPSLSDSSNSPSQDRAATASQHDDSASSRSAQTPSEPRHQPSPVEPALSAAPTPSQLPAARATGRAPVANVESYRTSPYAALLNRRRPSLGTSATVQTIRPMSESSMDPRERALDQIVDDFIAYDVGKLRGAAGAAARQRFAELGPEALPALVRGLNKAAGIHASCPVGVIAGKLITTLRTANDPSLREFAIANIGVGVPENAPRFSPVGCPP